MLDSCIPRENAIAEHLRHHGGLSGAEVFPAMALLDRIKAVVLENGNDVTVAAAAPEAGYALRPASDSGREEAASEEAASLETFEP